jgi:hypothetical protein
MTGRARQCPAGLCHREAKPARWPQGHSSVHWRPGHEVSGDPVMRIRCDRATRRACPTRQACTSAQAAPRQLAVRPQVHHEVLQAARQRQETPQFPAQSALRAGVESRLSQGIRRVDLRQSRYLGLARTHCQQLLTATAMNLVRVMAWLWGEPRGERRRQPGHLAQLASYPLSRQTVRCKRRTAHRCGAPGGPRRCPPAVDASGTRHVHDPSAPASASRVGHFAAFPTSGRGSGTNPSRFGILTSGRVVASITSCSPMMPLRWRR